MVTRSNFDLYQRNLALIQEMYPQYVPLLQDTPAPGYVIEALRPETYTCREGVEGPWRHGPGDPWGETEQAIQEANYTQQSLFLVIRPGLGYMPLSLYPLLRKGRNAQRMLIVEDRIALFRESLHRFDWTDILRSDRTILLLTENPIKAVVDFFVAQPVAMLPPFTGLCGVVVGEQETEIMNRLREVLNDMAHNVFRASEGFLQDLKDHYQAAQQQPLRPKRILLVEPEHEYLADSIGKGFQDE
ncbi:MAG: hypothetical protein RBU29_02580, partial [bacterium]|nr:hypothetical protein [bacterium]